MQKPMLDRDILAKWLGDIISEEMKKSDDEIAWDLVDECETFLGELYSDVVISEEQMTANIAKIKAKTCTMTSTPKARRTPRMRRVFAAGLAAAIILCSAVTAYAFVPSFRNMIQCVLKLDQGSSVEDGGVTYTYHGERIDYRNIDELVEKENLDILYPHNLPDELVIKYLFSAGEGDATTYTIGFVDNLATLRIRYGEDDASIVSDKSKVYVNEKDIASYIQFDNSIFTSVTIHNGYTYYVTTYNESHMTMILDSLY